jgi:hypothetical protein
MKSRHTHLRLMPVGAGVVLGAALVWAWDLARRGTDHARELGPPSPPAAIAAEPPLPGRTEPESRWSDVRSFRPNWPAGPSGRTGLFDKPGPDQVPGAEAPRIRRQEVALVATRDLPFRLQLIGHFGEGGNLSGIFEAEGTGSPWIARRGDELSELGLTVRAMEWAPGEVPARLQARIWDRRAEREVLLPESVRVPSGMASALLAPAGYPGEAIELLAGEVVAVGDSEFLVERIGLAPASATLRRLAVAGAEDDNELLLRIEEDPES